MDDFLNMRLSDFLDQAAAGEPVPGGGAVAALAGALGAAMAAMAANFTVGRPKFAEHEECVRAILADLAPLGRDLRQAINADALAFAGISAAYALPKNGADEQAERKKAIDAALGEAMRVPLRVAARCGEAAERLPELARRGNPNLLSDVEVAGVMLAAAVRAALTNIHANSSRLATGEARNAEAEGGRLARRIADLAGETAAIVRSRQGR